MSKPPPTGFTKVKAPPQGFQKQPRVPEAQPEPEAGDAESMSGSALRGFGQGASFGFSDELAGVVNAGVAALNKLSSGIMGSPVGLKLLRQVVNVPPEVSDSQLRAVVDAASQEGNRQLTGQPSVDSSGAYARGRDEARHDNAVSKAANPITYGGAEFAGALMAPGPKVAAGARVANWGAKGGMTLTKVGARVGTGLATGSLYGAGNSTADDTEGVLRDTAIGGGIGAVTSPLLGAGLDKAGNVLTKWSQENAVRAAGLTPGISNKMRQLGYETAEDARGLGKELLDMGAVKFGARPEAVQREVESLQPHYSQMVGDALNEADSKGVFRGVGAAQAMRGSIATGGNAASRSVEGPAMQMADMAEEQALSGPGTFQDANRMKRSMQDLINYKNPEPPLQQELQRKAVSAYRQQIEDQVRATAGDEAADALVAANKRLGIIHDVGALATDAETRDLAKNKLGQTLIGAAGLGGIGGSAVGGPIGGGLGAAVLTTAAKIAAPRVPAMSAVTQRQLAKVGAPLVSQYLEQPLLEDATDPEDGAGARFKAFAGRFSQ